MPSLLKSASHSSNPRLIIAASETSADMLYATKFVAPDSFVFLEIGGRKIILLSDLEIDRGRKQATVDEIVSYSEIEAKIMRLGGKPPVFTEVVIAFLKQFDVRRAWVPKDFPFALAQELTRKKIEVFCTKTPFWPEREIKDKEALKELKEALQITECGLQRAMEILKATKIRRDGTLLWRNAVLTAEQLRAEIESAFLFTGGFALNNSIVACGEQGVDPHERGHGPLQAHQLIILDVFPRAIKSGYYGDLTRTVVRGKASEAQQRIWNTCLQGQKKAIQEMKPGKDGKEIQDAVRTFFKQEGYATEKSQGRWQGFFHGLGHGLGLDLHEDPRLAQTKLKPGHVFTVEPGIYMPGLGGVRHEDVMVITEKGNRVLSHFPKELEI